MGKEVGDFLKSVRISEGLTQVELAELIGMNSGQHLSNVESGRAPLPDHFILSITRALGVDVFGLIETILHERCREIIKAIELPQSVADRIREDRREPRRKWLRGVKPLKRPVARRNS